MKITNYKSQITNGRGEKFFAPTNTNTNTFLRVFVVKNSLIITVEAVGPGSALPPCCKTNPGPGNLHERITG
jgi:hypothetical protein